jgi:DNA-binding NarL/FixJ family response regulator
MVPYKLYRKGLSALAYYFVRILRFPQLEVLRLIGQGRNNQEIAQDLYLTEGTVRNYVTRIISQLGVRDRVQTALWAKQHLLG